MDEDKHQVSLDRLNQRLNGPLLQTIIDKFPDAIYIGNAFGIPIINQPALEMLGYDNPQDLNRYFEKLADEIETRDFETGERLKPEEEPYARALLNGESVVKKVRLKHLKTGAEVVVRCATAPIILDKEIVGVIAINTEVTDESK